MRKPPPVTYSVVKAKRGTIENSIVVSGYYRYINQRTLFFKHQGSRLKRIYVGYGDKVNKGDLLAELDSDSLKLQFDEQAIILEKARVNYERISKIESDKYQRKLASLDVELAELRYNTLKSNLAKTRIVAPMSGVITYVTTIEAGEYIEPYKTILQIAEPTELVLHYRGAKASGFHLGAQVDIETGDKKYSGRIIMTPDNIPIDEYNKFENTVFIRPDILPPDVSIGDLATIRLILKRVEDAIVIPRNLIRNYLGGQFVYILHNGLKEERNVEVGIQTPTEAEVIKGLAEGEEVIIR